MNGVIRLKEFVITRVGDESKAKSKSGNNVTMGRNNTKEIHLKA